MNERKIVTIPNQVIPEHLNDTHMQELVLYEFRTKIHWNARLAASDVFLMFTQSVKFF